MNDTPRTAGIDTGFFADIGGVSQWLVLRGADRRNPALLVVGGPGFGYAALAPFFAVWERDFTVVHWDQPDAGFTFGKNGGAAAGALSIDRLARDGARVAEVACARLAVERVALLCISGGTIVGLQMLAQRPEIFSAYIGTGQFVDWARQDASSYALLIERARAHGDVAMLAELAAIGAPPYADTATDARKSKYAGAPTAAEAVAFAELMPLVAAAMQGVPAEATYLARGVDWPEPLTRATAAYDALRPELVSFDARRLGRRFAMPLFFFQGTEDAFSVTEEVGRYAAEIEAPRAELVPIEGAGHSAVLLREPFLARLLARVQPILLSPA